MSGEINSYVLDETTNSRLTIFLYKNVKNIPKLRQMLISGSLNCSVLKPNLIYEPFQIITAANKAAISKKRNTLTTKTINTEILFNLSISKNISQSLLKFGIDDKETNILVVFVSDIDDESDIENTLRQIDGDKVSVNLLQDLRDEGLIKKVYKISNEELKVSSFIDSIVSRIMTKDFVTY